MRFDVWALAPDRMQRLLHHQRQLIFEVLGSWLAGIAVAERAARLLRRPKFDSTDNRSVRL
jgi:hypothetical protein